MHLLFIAALLAVNGQASNPPSDVVSLDQASFDNFVFGRGQAVFVEFYAPWCGHCRHLEPIYEKLATSLKGVANIAKVDCTQEPHLAARFGIRGFPTLKLFVDGNVMDYHGPREQQAFIDFLKSHKAIYDATNPHPVPPPPTSPHADSHHEEIPTVLRYFDAQGRAEAIRLLLEEAGVAYVDRRFKWEEWVTEQKQNVTRYPFQQMPGLLIDGIDLVQSGAILRYVAKKFNFYPTDIAQQAVVDMVMGGWEDLRTKYNALVYDANFASKRSEFEQVTMPLWLGHFERWMNTKSGGEHVAIPQFTVADVVAFDILSLCVALDPNALNHFPRLHTFYDKYLQRPAFLAYYRSGRRPRHAHGQSAFWNNEKNPAPQLPHHFH